MSQTKLKNSLSLSLFSIFSRLILRFFTHTNLYRHTVLTISSLLLHRWHSRFLANSCMSTIRLPSNRYLSRKDPGFSATRDSLAFCARFLLAACNAATLFALPATICSFTNLPLCLSRVDMFWFYTLIFHLILYTLIDIIEKNCW